MIESAVGMGSNGEPLDASKYIRDGATLSADDNERQVSAALMFILARKPVGVFDQASIAAVAPGLLCTNREFVVGPISALRDITNLGVLVSVSGLPVQMTSTAAIRGGPLNAVREAIDRAAGQRIELGPGSVILASLPTSVVVPSPGTTIVVEIEGLGRVQVSA